MPVLYFKPHFALNVNLMHSWSHRNCKDNKYFEITSHCFYCSLHLPLEPLWRSVGSRKSHKGQQVVSYFNTESKINYKCASPPFLEMLTLQYGLIRCLFTCAMFCLFLFTKGSTALSIFISSLCGTFLSLDLPAGFEIKQHDCGSVFYVKM